VKTATHRLRIAAAAMLGLALTVTLPVAPSQAQPDPGRVPAASGLPKLPTAPVVRIGLFPNVTHAPALVAQELALFETFLGRDGTKVEYTAFNAGPAVIEAMKGGAIDVSYIGPNPAISGYTSTGGTLLRIVSGVASGGAALVVKPSITSIEDLRGKKIATPQLGNTQDVALRAFLKEKGFKTSTTGVGDVIITPTDNATTLSLFRRGEIDGAWTVEPWTTRLIQEGGAKVLIDEKDLWPGGQYVTTHIIASQSFLNKYPGTVRSIIQANNSAIKYIAKNVTKSRDLVNQGIRRWTGRALPDQVINRAWGNLRFTWDPLPKTLKKSADDAVEAGLLNLGKNKLAGIYDLRLLNQTLRASKSRTVSADGLGRQ
jgi:NitT/TauT family transport system substrate-binding protein